MLRRIGTAGRLLLGLCLGVVCIGIVSDGLLSDAHSGDRRVLWSALGAVVALAAALVVRSELKLRQSALDLTRAANAMAEGDLDARAPQVSSTTELGDVGRALNRLAASVSDRVDELRADRDLAAGILEGMGEGVLVLDEDGRIVLANRALRAMTLIAADAAGKSVIETMRNAALQQVLDEAATVDEAVVREVEIGGLKPRRVLVRASRMPDEGVAAVFLDVTDLRRLETIRTDFVANVSHELRTPVTAISTAVETLLAGALTDPIGAAEFAGVIERQARRLRQLVDDLLDLSKIEAKTYRLALAEAEVGPVVENAVRLVRDPAQARRVAISFEDAREPARARIDRRALEQVVSNLLENAIKYAGEGAKVRVSIKPRGERLHIAVADDGPGIAATHLGRIFERFYRVDAGRSRDLGGTGLGLSIVKHLVELMRGSIEVDSVVGKGTTFTVDLPRVAGD